MMARRVVERAAAAVATVWAVYVVLAFVLVPLAVPSLTVPVQFVSSAVFQAVMLPVLAYMAAQVQRQGDAASEQAKALQAETHDMVKAELADLALDLKTDREIQSLLERIEQLEGTILAAVAHG